MADLSELAKLSDIARQILIAARKNRDTVFLHRVGQGDGHIDAGSIQFRDRRSIATLKDLCEQGYFRTSNDKYHELSDRGMDDADALQNPEIIEQLELIRLRKIVLDDLHLRLLKGFNRAEEPHTQAERLSIELPRLRAVWAYLDRIGAVDLVPPPEGQGFPLNARLTARGIQLCKAADKAALAAPEGPSTTIIGDQITIAGRDAHHIEHSTTNIRQEGVDLEAVVNLIAAIRQRLTEDITDPAEREAALGDLNEVEAASNNRDPGVVAKAREALGRLCARVRPPAKDLATMFALYQMAEKLAQVLKLS